ncbi:MAG TPA: hypothetical protein VJQ55_12450, partial [Candidatus Binatia bacterium]|nr:hypothetical protein [Candidatus Binatia bacterium]
MVERKTRTPPQEIASEALANRASAFRLVIASVHQPRPRKICAGPKKSLLPLLRLCRNAASPFYVILSPSVELRMNSSEGSAFSPTQIK